MVVRIANNAYVSDRAVLADNASVWDFSQIREYATIGENTTIGSFVYIDTNVRIGKNCKIQNRALVYDPAIIKDGVFIGPGAILTNDKNPRSVSTVGKVKSAKDWEKVGVEVLQGASIGSGAICVAPVKIGKWALVGAGAVVTKDVKDYALVVGNPARQIGWVGKAGKILENLNGQHFKCPIFGTEYHVIDSSLVEIKE
jgi:UDP-2-acetamido-3-amino-2,3-dideoxy-glucuronate N-acetyltransferase